jgi:hypothetical protein
VAEVRVIAAEGTLTTTPAEGHTVTVTATTAAAAVVVAAEEAGAGAAAEAAEAVARRIGRTRSDDDPKVLQRGAAFLRKWIDERRILSINTTQHKITPSPFPNVLYCSKPINSAAMYSPAQPSP